MEMGSSSLTESGGYSSSSPPNSSEPLNGLKFGQKIYFEDVGLGAPAKSGSGAVAAQPRKAKGGVVQGGQPARCQVEGCGVDLSGAKGYYSRHKVCGVHSKTPKVVVAGLEQRFCQQCSRFHQLPEFDQGKRSCRRRLAGHNERRRKPQPGTLFSSRYSHLAPSVYENSSRAGSFVMDFSAYPRLERDAWPTTRFPEQSPENQNQNQVTATGKYLFQPWHGSTENPSPGLFLQGGVSDSSCALSLLSNQQWGSESSPSGLGMHANLMDIRGAPVNHFPNASWGFKGNEGGSSANGVQHDSGLGGNLFSGEELGGRGHYAEVDHSRPYDSTQQMHWSL